MTGKEKFHKVMSEFKAGTLESHDSLVTDRNQAIAIAFSEARKVEPEFGSNPVSLEQVKDFIELYTEPGNELNYQNALNKYSYLPGLVTMQIEKGIEQDKSPEKIWLELEQLNPETMPKKSTVGASKLKQAIEPKQKGKSKLKAIASKKTIQEQINEEEQAKSQLNVAEAFIEDRDKYISLNRKAYFDLAISEVKEYGEKMHFGHLRAMGETHIFYYSDKLLSLLDKYKIHYTLLENKDELIEYIEKL